MEQRRISVGSLRPPDQIIEIDGTEYLVRGSLPIETIAEMLDIETAVQTSEDGTVTLHNLKRGNEIIRDLLAEKQDVPKTLGLGIPEILALMSYLCGNDSVATEVADVVTGGKGAEAIAAAQAQVLAGEGEPGAEGAPLPSRKRSSRTSSGSASGTAGKPVGGATTRGRNSARTRRTSTRS